MQSKTYKIIEFFIIFLALPVSFALPYALALKLILGGLGFIYVVFVLLRVEKNEFKVNPSLNWKSFWKNTLFKLSLIGTLTILFVWFTNQENLFIVMLNKPLFWIMILFVYSIFSVYPQELLYRIFFFQRYKSLFSSEILFILINATVFSLAHLFFKNILVLILTFVGGILFALTFKKTKSTLLVSIEHAIYGCWLFTVGMGEMLGFPS
ncbi:CPBP family intramembrane glutamic endopeptidase [Lacinutrix iliipiscaria]|uniref:CPBP family intramembrane glutamic endopeptidase n=1 Tax=Lacinutrix iliipiscaria TaxID=1230532 RepID=A0ABW5WPA8_9FLAO